MLAEPVCASCSRHEQRDAFDDAAVGGLTSVFVAYRALMLLRTASEVATEVAEATGEMAISAVGSAAEMVTDSARTARSVWLDVLGLVPQAAYIVANHGGFKSGGGRSSAAGICERT